MLKIRADQVALMGVEPCMQRERWIEIALFDDDEQPVANEPYRVEALGGEVFEGRLDDNGWARIEGIPSSRCTVWFPEREPGVMVEPVPSVRALVEGWIDIVLEDDDERPVANEPYRVERKDGSVVEGRLDGEGRARVHGIPDGICTVSFPEREEDAVAKIA